MLANSLKLSKVSESTQKTTTTRTLAVVVAVVQTVGDKSTLTLRSWERCSSFSLGLSQLAGSQQNFGKGLLRHLRSARVHILALQVRAQRARSKYTPAEEQAMRENAIRAPAPRPHSLRSATDGKQCRQMNLR